MSPYVITQVYNIKILVKYIQLIDLFYSLLTVSILAIYTGVNTLLLKTFQNIYMYILCHIYTQQITKKNITIYFVVKKLYFLTLKNILGP